MAEKFDLDAVKFDFTCEDGTQSLTIPEYTATNELRALFGRQAVPPKGRRTLFMGRNIFSFRTDYLKDNKAKMSMFEEAERMYLDNPLRYFTPQCNDAIGFLNWRSEKPIGTMKVLHAGVGTGKSVLGVVDWLLDVVPTDPSWPIFGFGVKHREYRGAMKDGGVALVSYEMKNHQFTLWPQVIARWCPRCYIEEYLTGKASITWRGQPNINIAGSPIYFLASSQRDTAFVSQALHLIHWDEQSTEDKFNNANARVRRRDGRHICTMTPHALEGRADTGAGSYIDRIRKGEMDVGLDVRFFQMDRNKVADWVVTDNDKKKMMKEWIEDPIAQGNRKKLSEGKAVVYGEFHEKSGLVFDDWDRDVHIVQPFEIPSYWSIYRYHDHGRKEPNAAILVAVTPEDDKFIFAEYYEGNKEISENARGIVEDMTGNRLERDSWGGLQEVMWKHDVIRTISDPRSLSKKLDSSERTMRDEYVQHGLFMNPGSGQPKERLISIAGQLMSVDYEKKHFITGEKGAPGVYVFADLKKFIWEMEGYRMKTVRVIAGNTMQSKEKPVDKNDHLMEAFMQMAADDPCYIPKSRDDEEKNHDDEEENTEDARCSITGY